MNIEEALNLMDEMLDTSWSLPLSGGKCVIDIERMRDIVDGIRMNLPTELQQAQALLLERSNIVNKAKQEAEMITRKAEEHARIILSKDEAVKAAQQKANDIMVNAQAQSREMRAATHKFSDDILRKTEETMLKSLEDMRNTRKALRNSMSVSNKPASPTMPAQQPNNQQPYNHESDINR